MSMYPDEQTLVVDGQNISYPGLVGGKFISGDITDPSKPASYIPAESINLILDNISAFLVAAGLVPNNTSVTQLLQGITKYGNNYDLIIDSNAKLDYWINHTGGLLKRVLIRSGTWTASALGATAGVLINLDATGTTYVFAENGSSINYSGSFSGGILYGMFRNALNPDIRVEKYENIVINLTNTSAVGSLNSYGFYNLNNLMNCSATVITSVTTGGTGGSFFSCNNLMNCYGYGSGRGNANNSFAFISCTNLLNCIGIAVHTGAGDGFSDAFFNCKNVTNCTGTGTGTGAGIGTGFNSCTRIIECIGKGLSPAAGPGYGFYQCKKMQQNSNNGSKTSGYNVCYADSGTGFPAADTAAGGYNS